LLVSEPVIPSGHLQLHETPLPLLLFFVTTVGQLSTDRTKILDKIEMINLPSYLIVYIKKLYKLIT
jgi:hypothetical protein